MPAARFLRPRTLSIIFVGFFLVMAVLAGYAGAVLGYHYSPDITRWALAAYLIAGAVFLVGSSLAAIWTRRMLDERIQRLQRVAGADPEQVDLPPPMEGDSDEVPPPLKEAPSRSGNHVDRDIDELLVSLQQMEDEAGTVEEEEVVETAPPVEVAAEKASTVRSVEDREAVQTLAALRSKRDAVLRYFMGPILASIAVIGLSGAMLPGSDAFLQSYYQLNTAILLGLGYSFAGVAAYVGASILLLVRNH